MITPRLKLLLSGIVGSAVLLGLGCTTAPVQEMSDARQAISAARDVDAARRAPALLNDAEQSMQEAQLQLNNYFYTEARKRAVAAKAKAVQARRDAEAQRDAEQRQQARGAIEAAAHAIQDATALEAEWRAADGVLKDADSAFQAGNYAAAQTRAAEAEQLALQAGNIAYLEKARFLIDAAKAKRRLTSAERATVKAAEDALLKQQGKQAFLLISRLR